LSIYLQPILAHWLVFMHTSDLRPLNAGQGGLISPMRGDGQLGELAATYVITYDDGSEERVPIRRRYQVGAFQRIWGENCFEAVAHTKPRPVRAHHEQMTADWGHSQTRVDSADAGPWTNWLYAWQNPHPERAMVGLRAEPGSGTVLLCGLAALRWERRRNGTQVPAEPAIQSPSGDATVDDAHHVDAGRPDDALAP